MRIDLRGHGRSGHAPGAYDVDDYGEDVVGVLREQVGRPAVLVGHSLGGVVAWWVAQRHPELVAAAFLEDPPLYMGEPAEHELNGAVPLFQTILDTVARWKAEGTTADAAAAELAAAPFGADRARTAGEALCDDVPPARAEALLQMDPGVLEGAADRSTLAPTDTTSPVAVPVLVLAADDEMGSAFPARHAERLAITHPDVRDRPRPGRRPRHPRRARPPRRLRRRARALPRNARVGPASRDQCSAVMSRTAASIPAPACSTGSR